ncbi:carbohydrate ABC transporter permease [Aquibacillus albus]|uniref:Raffinose/stachyose/melibiose transport system permease protein n=1 Tax=Aquibacillus albus TaxID=1168171 RepID=A0ABS2MXS2_9BACI|nr:sugar ABC transporter permease [Aquibacillus albus]MBM7570588.1 raffinose/stachyose/melibiose transport system permease protein [Aquibacillus albus]
MGQESNQVDTSLELNTERPLEVKKNNNLKLEIKSQRRLKLQRSLKPFYFMAPALFIYLMVVAGPAFYTMYLSFFETNGINAAGKVFIGLGNYIELFTNDSVFITSLKNNIIWTVCSLAFNLTFALMLALMLNRSFKGRTIFRAVFYFPFILSNIVVAMIWVWLYHPNIGLFNEILSVFAIEPVGWLSNPDLALFSVFAASSWQHVGSSMIIFLAGLQTIPNEPYESAKVDGANRIQALWYITLPLLRETYIIVFATTLFYSMRVFDIIYAMTGGGPSQSTQVLGSWMYYQTFNHNNVGIGSAISVILLIVVMAVAIPYILWQQKKSHV